jgi:LmbE family N-acetylglucosaminyl deacetylase
MQNLHVVQVLRLRGVVTSGEAGIDGMVPHQARQVREAEQRASAAIVAVDAVEFLGWSTGCRCAGS